MTTTMDPRDLEKIIQAVTEEIVSYLGASRHNDHASAQSVDHAVCPECGQRCADLCATKIQRVVDAGADRLSAGDAICPVGAEIAPLIDHTLLKPEASADQIRKLCQEAVRYGFASVCVNPWYVPIAAECVRGTSVKVCSVVGFPLGATLPRVKIAETEEVIKLGAREIDMVINVGALKSGQDELVEADIRGVVEASHRGGAICKVILETALLTTDEKIRASVAAKRAGADFVKTSTGFSTGGATVEDVSLMRSVVGQGIGIKAAGGVRNIDDVQKMVAAGATRIGASASIKIIEQACAPAAAGG
jgi:deoxyribose-phosphate aldolase